MDKYKKYYGVAIFVILIVAMIYGAYKIIAPMYNAVSKAENDVQKNQQQVTTLRNKQNNVKSKIAQIESSISTSQKKVYSPVESNLENDTLFFTLYSDVIEMLHTNKIKINSIDYSYNPENDAFVRFGKDIYFVCDINMEIVSNYVNIGKFIENVYQYPYYIRINEIDVKPYQKDKKILIANVSLRLYSHTIPEVIDEETPADSTKANKKITNKNVKPKALPKPVKK